MRIYSRDERSRRLAARVLLAFGSLPLLGFWLPPKLLRLSRGEPFFAYALGISDLIWVALFGVAVWNCWRMLSKPHQHADIDLTTRDVRVYQMGGLTQQASLANVGPIRMSARTVYVSSGKNSKRPITTFVVGFQGLPKYDVYESKNQTRVRARMERLARDTGLSSVTLGGAARDVDRIDISLVERVRQTGERISRPEAPASTRIEIRERGDGFEIASKHFAIVPLVLAAAACVAWAVFAYKLMPDLREEWRLEEPWITPNSVALGVSAVAALAIVAMQVFSAIFNRRVLIKPEGVRYGSRRVPIDAVEEIAGGPNGVRLWTDRGPLVISADFCPSKQFVYLAQVLKWAVVEAGRRRVS